MHGLRSSACAVQRNVCLRSFAPSSSAHFHGSAKLRMRGFTSRVLRRGKTNGRRNWLAQEAFRVHPVDKGAFGRNKMASQNGTVAGTSSRPVSGV